MTFLVKKDIDMMKILVFGTGNIAYKIFNELQRNYEIVAFIDNNKDKSYTFFDSQRHYLIVDMSRIEEFAFDKIVIASDKYCVDMIAELHDAGIKYDRMVLDYVSEVKSIKTRLLYTIQQDGNARINQADIALYYLAFWAYSRNDFDLQDTVSSLFNIQNDYDLTETKRKWEKICEITNQISLAHVSVPFTITDSTYNIVDDGMLLAASLFFGLNEIQIRVLPQRNTHHLDANWIYSGIVSKETCKLICDTISCLNNYAQEKYYVVIWTAFKDILPTISCHLEWLYRREDIVSLKFASVEELEFCALNLLKLSPKSYWTKVRLLNEIKNGNERNEITILKIRREDLELLCKTTNIDGYEKKLRQLQSVLEKELDLSGHNVPVSITDSFFNTYLFNKLLSVRNETKDLFAALNSEEYVAIQYGHMNSANIFASDFNVCEDSYLLCAENSYLNILKKVREYLEQFSNKNGLKLIEKDYVKKHDFTISFEQISLLKIVATMNIAGIADGEIQKIIDGRIKKENYYIPNNTDYFHIRLIYQINHPVNYSNFVALKAIDCDLDDFREQQYGEFDKLSLKVGYPIWMYAINHFKPIEKKENSHRRVISCTYRQYSEKEGKTGGPGGVQFILRASLGHKIRDTKVDYLFKDNDIVFPKIIRDDLADYDILVGLVIYGACWLVANRDLSKSIRDNDNPFLLCHDLGTAYAAYLMGLDYSLVYHQQGSILREIQSSGRDYSEADCELISFIERVVFSNAVKVYFPSKGAEQFFLNTTRNTKESVSPIHGFGEALYNTINRIDEHFNSADIEAFFNTDDTLFMSISDYKFDKGLDRIPSFLQKYQETTKNTVRWLVIGDSDDDKYVNGIQNECLNKGILCKLITKRQRHDIVMSYLARADYYIMLHRNSIFDIATLEAMKLGKRVVLSDCIANREFNTNDNVLILTSDLGFNVDNMIEKDKQGWGNANKKAFGLSFDMRAFCRRYARNIYLDAFAEKYTAKKSSVNNEQLGRYKNAYEGRTCIICGAGESLDSIKLQRNEYVYIALNRALFYEKIHFDMLFMQDEPSGGNYSLKDFNEYDCEKFYGIITNPRIKVKGLGDVNRKFDNVKGSVVRYELSSRLFDNKLDEFEWSLDHMVVQDAQSVLFSALQFAVFSGFSRIGLCGVEFSSTNYSGANNESRYVSCVVENLIEFKRQFTEQFPDRQLFFIDTTNAYLQTRFEEIDELYS